MGRTQITSNYILDLSISTNDIANGAITNDKIAAGTIQEDRLAFSVARTDIAETITQRWNFNAGLDIPADSVAMRIGATREFQLFSITGGDAYVYNYANGANLILATENASGSARQLILDPDSNILRPNLNNTISLGNSSYKFKDMWAYNRLYLGSGTNDWLYFDAVLNEWQFVTDGTIRIVFDDNDIELWGTGARIYLQNDGYILMDERTSNPSTPSAGDWTKFFKSDGLYIGEDTGTVYKLGPWTKKVSAGLLFPDQANSTSDSTGPRWTELAGPGSISLIRYNYQANAKGFFRAGIRVPEDWVPGTDITIRMVLGARNSSNVATSDFIYILRYIDIRGPGDAPGGLGATWNLLSGSNLGVTVNSTVTDVSIYTISAANISLGDVITMAFQFSSINTGNNIFVKDVYIEYQGQS